jgi:3-hydroxybutyryl-CoA dehydratase
MVRAQARITTLDRGKRRAGLDCAVSVGDKVVLEGEALVLVPSRG